MSAGHRDDDLFDAMLGVALREGAAREGTPCGSAPGSRPSGPAGFEDAARAHQEGTTRPHATWRERMPLLLAAAGLLICGAVWWLLRFPPGDDPVDLPADRSATESGDVQDPVEISEWIERLADPAQRSQAIAALVAAGEKGADAVADAIAATPARDGEAPHPRFMGLLAAAARFGPRADRFLEPLRDRVDDFQTDQIVDVMAVFTHAALFHDVDHPGTKISAARLQAFGRRWEGGGVEAANRCMLDHLRLVENREARTWAEKGMLGDLLTGPEPGVRLAALERMACDPAWDPEWTPEVEGALLAVHPTVARPTWADNQRIGNDQVDLTPEIHAAAAHLLLDRCQGRVESALGHAWVLRRSDDPAACRRAAMALGTLLAGTREGPRVEHAVAALAQAADGPDLDLARDAVTSLGMLEGAARSALPLLERLAESSDGGLAARARAARDRILGQAPSDASGAAALIEGLADPAQRARCIVALVQTGEAGADAVAEALRTAPTRDGESPSPLYAGLLSAAQEFGPRTDRFVQPLLDRAAEFEASHLVEAWGVFEKACLWHDVPSPREAFRAPQLTARAFWAETRPERFVRTWNAPTRLSRAHTIRELAARGALASSLADLEADLLLGALERMEWEADGSDAWIPEVESILGQQFRFVSRFVPTGPAKVVIKDVDLTEAVHAAAASLLVRHRGDDPRSASGHAWVVEHAEDPAARRRSAMALGTLLAGRASGPRRERAVKALITAAGGSDLEVAREAVTSLGLLEADGPEVVTLLDRLTQHSDAGLAAGARATLQRLRGGPNADPARPLVRAVEQLADPERRGEAIAALVAQGAKGAELVELGLRRSPTMRGGKPDPMFTGLLEAARAFGPQTARFLDPIQQRAAQMDVHQAIAAYGVFVRAALWEDIANPHGTSGVHSLKAFGQEWADPGLDGANRIQQFHVEFLGAKAVREAFDGVDDQADAAKWADSGALVRLAALARLAWESEWNPAWTEPLTRMLVEEQPPLIEGWWKDALTLDNRRTDVTEAIRDRAAALILRHATDATATVFAHGWIVGHGAGSEARCASAQALGRLLADPADRNPARVENALAALQKAAEGDDLALAREAVTSLGMMGQAAASASALLERLEAHPDRGLAERARAALVQVRR